MIAVPHGAHADALHVGARARLRDADGADQFAARHARQPALLLFLGAVVEDVVRADAVHALAEARDAAPAEFFVQQRFVAEIPATTAVFGRDVHAQETRRADLAPGFLVDVVLVAPFRVERRHLGFDITGDRLAQHAQVVVHPGRFVGCHGVAIPIRKDAAGRWCALRSAPVDTMSIGTPASSSMRARYERAVTGNLEKSMMPLVGSDQPGCSS